MNLKTPTPTPINCDYCGEPLLKDQMVKVQDRAFHWECFFLLGEALRKSKQRIAKEKKNREDQAKP